jgi:hypothetical protein
MPGNAAAEQASLTHGARAQEDAAARNIRVPISHHAEQ